MENPRADRALASGFGLLVGLGCSVHGVVRALERVSYGDHDAAAGSVLMGFAGASFAAWMLRWWSGARLLHLAWMGSWFAFLLFLVADASSHEVTPIVVVGALGLGMILLVGWRIGAASAKPVAGAAAKPAPAGDAASPIAAKRPKKKRSPTGDAGGAGLRRGRRPASRHRRP